MPESLTDLFTEAMQDGGIDAVEALVDDLDVDNPEDGADDFEDVVQDDEDDFEDADTEDESDEEDESEPAADEDDFDWNGILERYGDRTVTLTVQGEPVEVKVKDLPNGFMMREDYSRKTAEVSKVTKAATWAQDVQDAFANDPVGTLQAFAQAYGIQLPNPAQPEVAQADPYEDLDPDVAAVLRKMDEQERRYEAELNRVQSQLASFENQRIQEEIRAEMAELRSEFGDDLDSTEMLRIAAVHNMTLREAAEIVVGKVTYAKSKEQLAAEQVAREASEKRSGKSRAESKRRASGTTTKKFDASNVSVEDFNTIGELFEIEMNSVST